MLVFRRAIGDDDLGALYRLRYQVYCCEKGYIASSSCPDGIECDHLDEHSVHFVAYEDNAHRELLGCFRLILPSEHGLPVENHFELITPSPVKGKAIELSRLVVVESARSIRHHILMGLSKQVYLYNQINNVSECYAALEEPLLHLVNRLGLPFERVGAAQHYLGAPCIPVMMRMDDLEESLPSKNQWFYDYLQSPDHEQSSWF